MNVLLLEFDLFKSVGGGQTVYKRLIETNPQITFYYFGLKEEAAAQRPANARLVPFKVTYPVRNLTGEFGGLDQPLWTSMDYANAANFAAAAAHLPIDVVDVADYKFFAYFLAPALRRHGLGRAKVALAMHGNMSETQRVNWGSKDLIEINLDQREQWQYRTADLRYGISLDYIDHWERVGGTRAQYLNPLQFVLPPKMARWRREDQSPALNFIGRTEGFKGPDLFLELLTWLPAGSYKTARIIGPGVVDAQGVSSATHLRNMAARRGLKVDLQDCVGRAEMLELFGGRSLTVLPSRMDTFNLTALESIYAGCPVAVSDQAGVCRFLRETYPGLPFACLPMHQIDVAAAKIRDLLDNYDAHRETLRRTLEEARPVLGGPDLRSIYESAPSAETHLCDQTDRLYARVEKFHERHFRYEPARRLVTLGLKANDSVRTVQDNLKSSGFEPEPNAWPLHRQLYYLTEGTPQEIDRKVAFAADITRACRLDRGRSWAELARLERMRGNDFVAATYDLRVMRVLGEDRLGQLPWVTTILRDNGYVHEAEAAVALYGPKDKRHEHARRLLTAAREKHRAVPAYSDFAFIEDTRSDTPAKVSVIVSLYKAANKLGTFLRMLHQHEWVRDGRVELVLVDSNSPTDEHAVFRQAVADLGVRAVYARSHERETIQKAWNRGILLARAPYLCFLGVDEMVRPDCFPVLAGELDADPQLDWVQGNSVITEVNPQGTLLRDVMIYQRIPYEQDLVLLETCYLSWVGGMYRRDIHERFGYYDDSFGAAGDTEYKNRILPFIRSKTVPQTLGVFLNYPEERTTQSPRAEVEDLRAWYLHRSAAGVEYALANREPVAALGLLAKAVGYRKSYCGHTSTDVELAHAVAEYAAERLPDRHLAPVAAALEQTLQLYRSLEWLNGDSPRAGAREFKRTLQLAQTQARTVQTALGLAAPPTFAVLNDNRYEQHAWPWEAKPLAETFVPGQRTRWLQTKTPVSVVATASASTAPQAVAEIDKLPGRLIADVRQHSEKFRLAGKLDLARDLGVVAQFLADYASGKDAPASNGPGAGPALCRFLLESLHGRGGPITGGDAATAALCAQLAEVALPILPELGDAFDGLAVAVSHHLEQTRTAELAARLLTYPVPADAVRKHSTELNRKVLETVQRAATSAKVSGNATYAGRLITLAGAIQGEITARESRSPLTAVA